MLLRLASCISISRLSSKLFLFPPDFRKCSCLGAVLFHGVSRGRKWSENYRIATSVFRVDSVEKLFRSVSRLLFPEKSCTRMSSNQNFSGISQSRCSRALSIFRCRVFQYNRPEKDLYYIKNGAPKLAAKSGHLYGKNNKKHISNSQNILYLMRMRNWGNYLHLPITTLSIDRPPMKYLG